MYNDFFAIFESLILTRAKMKQEDKSWAVGKNLVLNAPFEVVEVVFKWIM